MTNLTCSKYLCWQSANSLVVLNLKCHLHGQTSGQNMIALFPPVILDLIANRLVLVFTYPNIAEASARVMNHSEITFKEIVEPLFAVIKEGVEEGHKSEFVGRLLLIFLGFIVLKQYSHII